MNSNSNMQFAILKDNVDDYVMPAISGMISFLTEKFGGEDGEFEKFMDEHFQKYIEERSKSSRNGGKKRTTKKKTTKKSTKKTTKK